MEKGQDPIKRLLVQQTINFLETDTHSMPLDLTCCTPFQQIVFNTISTISPENIFTYKDMVEIIGKPTAKRALGSELLKILFLILYQLTEYYQKLA